MDQIEAELDRREAEYQEWLYAYATPRLGYKKKPANPAASALAGIIAGQIPLATWECADPTAFRRGYYAQGMARGYHTGVVTVRHPGYVTPPARR